MPTFNRFNNPFLGSATEVSFDPTRRVTGTPAKNPPPPLPYAAPEIPWYKTSKGLLIIAAGAVGAYFLVLK